MDLWHVQCFLADGGDAFTDAQLEKRGRTAQVLVNNCVKILYWSCIELVVNSLDIPSFPCSCS